MINLMDSPLKVDSTTAAGGGRVGGRNVTTTGAFFTGMAPAPEFQNNLPSVQLGGEPNFADQYAGLAITAAVAVIGFVLLKRLKK